MSEETSKMKEVKKKSRDSTTTLLAILVAVMVLVLIFNSVRIMSLTGKATSTDSGTTNTNTGSNAIYSVIPTGVPAIYGSELGVKYDDVSANNPQSTEAAIIKLASYEGDKLTGEQMERYLVIGSSIACEYCCGAETLIFSNGQAACGCAHSYAMRGLAKYLLEKHPDMTNDQILEELGKWKVLFFPDVHAKKAAILKDKGIELNYINLASNKYRGIEQGASGGMVGGC